MQLTIDSGVQHAMTSELLARFPALGSRVPAAKEALARRVEKWQENLQLEFSRKNPYASHEQILQQWQQNSAQEGSARMLADAEKFFQAIGRPFQREFWNRKLGLDARYPQSAEGLALARRALFADWQKSLDFAVQEWQLTRLQAQRERLFQDLEMWLALLDQLRESLEKLGLEPGLWLDLGTGELTAGEIERFTRWATYLRNDKGARSVSELLGRMRQAGQSERIEQARQRRLAPVQRIAIDSSEEIIGLRLAKDIEHAVSGELALVASEDTGVLFDLKYLESRLLFFEVLDIEDAPKKMEKEEPLPSSDTPGFGPMIVCIDTSGSMQGQPEFLAKAMALYLATQAKLRRRACHIINFSTRIDCFDTTREHGLDTLIHFLMHSFHGGTDSVPALRHALDMMQSENYQRADLLMISDFLMRELPVDLRARIEGMRRRGHRFNSLVIGNPARHAGLTTLCDAEWMFNPATQGIHELVRSVAWTQSPN